MSAYGMTLTVLANGLADAVRKDEDTIVEQGGYDISAGLFGVNVSAWLREVADQISPKEPR